MGLEVDLVEKEKEGSESKMPITANFLLRLGLSSLRSGSGLNCDRE